MPFPWLAAAAFGGSLLGGSAARSGAKRAAEAQRYAADASQEAFRFSQPYIKESYDKANSYLSSAQGAGAYGGQTLAGPNPYELAGNQYMGNMGNMGAQGAFGMTQQGQNFAKNYADLYEASKADRMGAAQQYAIDNSQPLVNATMRDDYRNLTEQTLPGINLGASASGNINSSRAGMADAIAQRGYGDRKADVTASIQDSLMNRSLAEQQQSFANRALANQGLQGAYGTGINAMRTMGNWMTGAGSNLRGYDQMALDDARAAFERKRDFGLDTQMKYQQGILGNAVYDNKAVQPNYHDPSSAAFGGAMQGAGYGMDMAKFFKDWSGQPKTGDWGGDYAGITGDPFA
jgi:hypothetical protein